MKPLSSAQLLVEIEEIVSRCSMSSPKSFKKDGSRLCFLCEQVYFHYPELEKLAVVRRAKVLKNRLKRAGFVKKPKNRFFGGGAPGLGKHS